METLARIWVLQPAGTERITSAAAGAFSSFSLALVMGRILTSDDDPWPCPAEAEAGRHSKGWYVQCCSLQARKPQAIDQVALLVLFAAMLELVAEFMNDHQPVTANLRPIQGCPPLSLSLHNIYRKINHVTLKVILILSVPLKTMFLYVPPSVLYFRHLR